MAGRGFLKSRLANITSKKQSTPEESLKLATQPISHTDVPNVLISGISSQALLPTNQEIVRGRRAMLSRMAQRSSYQNVRENMSSRLFKIELENVKDLLSTTTSGLQNAVESNLLVPPNQSQQKIVDIIAPKEEKSPIIHRVLKKSDNDFYHMTQLSSNYIRVRLEEDKGVYKYNVHFDPTVDAKCDRMFLVNEHTDLYPVKTFDGTLLFVPKMLPQDVTTLKGKLKDESEVTIIITFKCKCSLSECINFYNIFLRKIMMILGLKLFGRNFYDPNKKITIPELKLQVWPGIITIINEFENGLYMCCEVTHRILHEETVIQIMTDIMMNSKKINSDSKHEIMTTLCGSTVITHYNQKTYRIDHIDFKMNPLSTFNQGGIEVTFAAYYKKMYDIEIKNLQQPMLITTSNKKDKRKNVTQDSDICCLVPELCNLTGLTKNLKSNLKLTNKLKKYTLVTPEKRQHAIIEFVNRVNENEIAYKKFKDWGLMMSPVPVTMEGPVYKRETILLGNSIRKQIGPNMDWGMDVSKNTMFVSVNILKWAIIYNSRDETTARSFFNQLVVCSRAMSMQIHQPINVPIKSIHPESYLSTINGIVRNNSNLQLLVVIFPTHREDLYNSVKRICCLEFGIPSQIIVSRTLSRPERLQSITQKIALQINCKLGGAGWAIDIPLKNTMIVGIDIYHEKDKKSNSVVGFVASMNKTFTEWCSVAVIQKITHQELVDSMPSAFHKFINQYKAKNGLFPEKIIIYRDGVSNGDFKNVENIEISDLITSFLTYPGNYNPMVSFIIVQKRINTRIFQFLNQKYSNPSPGTIIDNTITKRNYFDFYLVSQHVGQGTVNPTHYIVLKNECNLNIENMQRLSYKLCHLYYNWTGTIKVPAPLQYAHKLAYLIGQNVRQMPKDNLCDTLFFL